VIDKQGIVHQIANVIENVTNHTYGYDIVGGGYFNDNTEGVRLWTIQDAKDGDVLASELCYSIILYKCIEDGNIQFYCDYDFSDIDMPGDRFSINSGQHYGNVKDSTDFHPATKEQRDLLFQKMKEAGYGWDANKKELKKIEQRMVSAEAKEAMYSKPAEWSEKDEYNYNTILHHLDLRKEKYKKECNQEEQDRYQGLYDWLKSLRHKNTWKPSKEQMDALESAIVDSISSIQKHSLESLYNELKKLF
jgi:hypothetical protein